MKTPSEDKPEKKRANDESTSEDGTVEEGNKALMSPLLHSRVTTKNRYPASVKQDEFRHESFPLTE